MARINIEDSLYKDHRFIKLYIKLGSIDLALGLLVRAWSIAQEFYLKDDRHIPREEWDKQNLNDLIIEVGLATEVNGRIKVSGSDEQFSWLLQRVEAGRRGGQSRGKQDQNLPESERIKRSGARSVLSKAIQSGAVIKPSYCQDCGKTDCIIEGHHSDYDKPLEVDWLCKSCHTETHRNIRQATAKLPLDSAKLPLADTKPSSLTPSLTLSPSPSLSLTHTPSQDITPMPSVKGAVKNRPSKGPEVENEFQLACRKTWEAYVSSYQSRYRVEPLRNAKVNSQIKAFVSRVGKDDSPLVAEFYLTHNSAKYISNAHSTGLMLADAEKLRTEWLRGKQITSSHARSIENKQQNINAFSKFLNTGNE